MKKLFFFSGLCLTAAVLLFSACGKDSNVDCSKYNSTYNSNMKAIIDDKCVGCHSNGGSAESSGDYSTYAKMKPYFAKSWAEIDAGRMPEVGSTPLTDAEKEAFECWKTAGFPEN